MTVKRPILAAAVLASSVLVTQGATPSLAHAAAAPVQGNKYSDSPSLSQDGRYVAFVSGATNLVRGDTNAASDVFLRDRSTGTTRRISLSSSGGQANGASQAPSISADGRYIAFASSASNLVAGDTNGASDVFVRDVATAKTTRVSVNSGGTQGNADSGLGYSLADPFNGRQVDLAASGQYVVFTSGATNLVRRDTNNAPDVFLRDLGARTTSRVSVTASGGQANDGSYGASVSADGTKIGFGSYASNMVPNQSYYASPRANYVRDRSAKTTTQFDKDQTSCGFGDVGPAILSDNGSTVAWDARDGCDKDIYATKVLGPGGYGEVAYSGEWVASYGAISADGSRSAYYDDHRRVVAVRVWATGQETTLPALGGYLALSPDGQSVALATAQALLPEDTNGVSDVYVWTPALGTVRRVSVG